MASIESRIRRIGCAAMAAALLLYPEISRADESGISFWLPGLEGSLAAVPTTPGWSLGTIYYHTSVNATGAAAAAREFQVGRFSPTVNINLNLSLSGQADLLFVAPTYTFATPVLGGQLSATMAGVYGRNSANNFMVYGAGDIPVGNYDPNRLANIGIGHGAIDFGGGYTYLNPVTGNEFSAVGGFTYNFKNPDTQYQSGIDFHLDWGASHFLSKQVFVGLVGYAYQQITDDFGQPAVLGGFRSRVLGIGPQLGYIFPIGDNQAFLGVKGYGEFDAANRPSGWNTWLTFAISEAAPKTVTPTKHLVTK